MLVPPGAAPLRRSDQDTGNRAACHPSIDRRRRSAEHGDQVKRGR
jgi:hypothetical protein